VHTSGEHTEEFILLFCDRGVANSA